MGKEYVIIGYIENDESRPNTEILSYLNAENDKEALEIFKKYKPKQKDFLTGEKLTVVSVGVFELRKVV